MSTSYDLDDLDHLVPGAVGEPGERVFYLQAVRGEEVVTLRCEKQQVAALSDYLEGVLARLPQQEVIVAPDAPDLVEPLLPEWVMGGMGVALNEERGRVVLLVEEMVPVDEEGEVERTPATARFSLTPVQVRQFVERAGELVAAGRPTCPICGRPMEPDGHTCPRSNGHGVH